MSFFPKITTSPADGPNTDAFQRQRVGTPETLFDSKQLLDGMPLLWATQNTSGSFTTWTVNRSSTIMTATSSVGSRAVRQTRRRFNYQPGKSLLVNQTFIMGSFVPGFRKDVGYYDENNGLFFQQDATGSLNLVRRSNVTGTAINTIVSQSLWNLDRLDGSGPSGFKLDPSRAQIMAIDMQWLGVGRVRMGFIFSGSLVFAHQFTHSNEATAVYMSVPNLPVRHTITCDSGSFNATSTLEHICSSVISEGGYDPKGLLFAADRGPNLQSGIDSSALYPLISLRLKSGSLTTNVLPRLIDVLTTTNNATFRWALVLNPTINGSDAASWVPVTSSSVEYDVSRTITNSLSGGIVLRSGYASNASQLEEALVDSAFAFGAEVDGTRDQLVLAVQTVGGGTNAFVGSITWRELS